MEEDVNLTLTRQEVFFIISMLNQRKFYLQEQLKVQKELIDSLAEPQIQADTNVLEIAEELYKNNLDELVICVNEIAKLTEAL